MAAVASWHGGDNALAHDSKTRMRIRTYKAATRNLARGGTRACHDAGRHCHNARIPDPLFMPTKRTVVAVIDDNVGVLGAMSRLLSAFGYDTELYASAEGVPR